MVNCETTTGNVWKEVSMTDVQTDKLIDKINEVKNDVCKVCCTNCGPECRKCLLRGTMIPKETQINRLVQAVKGCNALTNLSIYLTRACDVYRFFLDNVALPATIKDLKV